MSDEIFAAVHARPKRIQGITGQTIDAQMRGTMCQITEWELEELCDEIARLRADSHPRPETQREGVRGMDDLWKDIDIRVIDQRIGQGVGGMNTVIRILHRPSGIIVEVPRVTGSQHSDRELAMDMIAAAITHPKYRGEP